MIPFVSLQDVKTRMAIGPNIQGVDDIIQSGINAAYLFVRGQLDSDFDQQVRTDTFYLDESMNGGVTPNGFWRLRLVSGLIDMSQPIAIASSDNWNMSDPTSLASNLFKIDPQKGVVSIPSFVRDTNDRYAGWFANNATGGLSSGSYVSVSYTSGFTSSTTTDSTQNPPVVTTTIDPPAPDWLVEAILSYVPSVFLAQQPTNKPAKDDSNGDNADIVRHVMSVLEDYSRTGLSFYLNPVF